MRRPGPARPRIAGIAVLLGVLASACATGGTSDDKAAQRTYFVSPDGEKSATGKRADDATTLQGALNRVGPGDVIRLGAGTYQESKPFTTRAAGTKARPITIRGDEKGLEIAARNKTILLGGNHVLEINHSNYVLEGFTVDGQPDLNFDDIPRGADAIEAYKDDNQSRIAGGQLIYIGAKAKDVTGTIIRNMFLTGAGRECIRMRSFAKDNLVTQSRIYRCGFLRDDKAYPYHNGEGVYIGTSPKSVDQPYFDGDNSSGNIIRGNIIETFGSECVDIKENASGNIIDGNQCAYSLGPASDNEAMLEVRGMDNRITENIFERGGGLGVKIWSDEEKYGGRNVVSGNRFSDIAGTTLTVKLQSPPPVVCGNTYQGGTATLYGVDGPIDTPCD